tara:strand:+ start:491 stop:937 length:447 start_codon:yes stop_codon:yes gene_type:complete
MTNYNFKSIPYKLKQLILVTFLFLTLGSLLELYLIGHYEDTMQLIPIFCVSISLFNLLLLFFKVSKFTTNLFKVVLCSTLIVGIYGVYLHLKSNYQFEYEIRPSKNYWVLLKNSFSGALPTLAPLSLVVLSLVGYSYLIIISKINEKI